MTFALQATADLIDTFLVTLFLSLVEKEIGSRRVYPSAQTTFCRWTA